MDQTNRSLLVQRGSIERVLEAMKRFDDDRGVLKLACWALYALAWNNSSNKDRIVKVVGTVRISDAIGVVTGEDTKRYADDIDACLRGIDGFMQIPIKDINARYALLAALRTMSMETKKDEERSTVANSASRVYATRNVGDTRYLLCCITHCM